MSSINPTLDTVNKEKEDKPLSFKEQVQDIISAFYKEVSGNIGLLKASVELVQRFRDNIIKNPNEEKFRTIKSNNPRIKEALTKYYNGLQLLKLIGFQEFYDPTNQEPVLKVPMSISGSYMKMQKLDFDSVVNTYFLSQN